MSEITTNYTERNASRQLILEKSTIEFVTYFALLGVPIAEAEQHVADLSTEVSLNLYPFVLGNTQPLLTAIQASTLPFMDQSAKDALISYLSV